MTERIAAIEEQLKQAREKLRVVMIENAAASSGAIVPAQIAILLDAFVKTDDTGSVFVINAEGQRRFDRNGAPFSVHSAVREYLDRNPHMKKNERGERND